MKIRRCVAMVAFSVVFCAFAVPALSADPQGSGAGIPSTAVARLKIAKGTAWVRTGDAAQWEEAITNYTLAEKSRISVPEGSEAEIQFRGSQGLLLRGGSEVDIRKLGEDAVSYRLRSGKVELSLPKEDFAPVRVKVPGDREVRLDAPGRYLLTTDGGTTKFVVVDGKGAVVAGKYPPIGVNAGEPIGVNAGEEASIGKDILVGRAESAAPAPELAREEPLTEAEKEADVPPEVAGELRNYGEWVDTPQYGYVWRPYVDDGWEPYYYGRWDWVDPYGWTWVGYEPWGWWPYHTGWWWPSPVFGWVWCPFHSFVSFDFHFGRSEYFCHNARFFPGNVRFAGRGEFVRWVPARPGEIASRSRSFPRNDARLARWDRPVDRGAVMVRHDGGRPVAWEGRGGGARSARYGMTTGTPRNGLVRGGSAASRSGNAGAVRSGQAIRGTAARSMRGEETRMPAANRARPSGNFGRYGGPMRSSAVRAPSRIESGSMRGYERSVPAGGYYRGGPSGGYTRSAPAGGSFRGGAPRGFDGGGARGFAGGDFRGSGGEGRGSAIGRR